MPQVLAEHQKNLYVYIFTNDHTPAHVHVFKGRKNDPKQRGTVINIGTLGECPTLVLADEDIEDKHILEAIRLVAANQKILLDKWQEYHGVSKLGRGTNRRKAKGRDSQGKRSRKTG